MQDWDKVYDPWDHEAKCKSPTQVIGEKVKRWMGAVALWLAGIFG